MGTVQCHLGHTLGGRDLRGVAVELGKGYRLTLWYNGTRNS